MPLAAFQLMFICVEISPSFAVIVTLPDVDIANSSMGFSAPEWISLKRKSESKRWEAEHQVYAMPTAAGAIPRPSDIQMLEQA